MNVNPFLSTNWAFVFESISSMIPSLFSFDSSLRTFILHISFFLRFFSRFSSRFSEIPSFPIVMVGLRVFAVFLSSFLSILETFMWGVGFEPTNAKSDRILSPADLT